MQGFPQGAGVSPGCSTMLLFMGVSDFVINQVQCMCPHSIMNLSIIELPRSMEKTRVIIRKLKTTY